MLGPGGCRGCCRGVQGAHDAGVPGAEEEGYPRERRVRGGWQEQSLPCSCPGQTKDGDKGGAARPRWGRVGWGGVWWRPGPRSPARRGGHGAPALPQGLPRVRVTAWETGPGCPIPCTEHPAPLQGKALRRWSGGREGGREPAVGAAAGDGGDGRRRGRGPAPPARSPAPGPLLPPPEGARSAHRPDVTRPRRRPATRAGRRACAAVTVSGGRYGAGGGHRGSPPGGPRR